jgi:hypothetical protein
MSMPFTQIDRAVAAWGDDLPLWVADLAQECALTSQNKVAARLNRSATVVSQVISRSYGGSYEAIEEVFKGAFKGLTVACPALGEIPANVCRDWRAKSSSFSSVNKQRVDMYRACNRCPRNGKGGAE